MGRGSPCLNWNFGYRSFPPKVTAKIFPSLTNRDAAADLFFAACPPCRATSCALQHGTSFRNALRHASVAPSEGPSSPMLSADDFSRTRDREDVRAGVP